MKVFEHEHHGAIELFDVIEEARDELGGLQSRLACETLRAFEQSGSRAPQRRDNVNPEAFGPSVVPIEEHNGSVRIVDA
jgi:hypothetical protein